MSGPLIWLTLICIGSTDILSAEKTGGIVKNRLGGSDNWNFTFRKLGHVLVYLVLTILIWLNGNLHPCSMIYRKCKTILFY